MTDLKEAVIKGLSPLLGMKLSAANYGGNVRFFHFGDLSGGPEIYGVYAIHLQCPWRLESKGTILTGPPEWYIRAEESTDDDWDPSEGGSLQELQLRKLMGDTESSARSIVNRTKDLVVTDLAADVFGGFRLDFSGGVGLSVFPSTNRGEQWRILRPKSESKHLVVEDGKVYYD